MLTPGLLFEHKFEMQSERWANILVPNLNKTHAPPPWQEADIFEQRRSFMSAYKCIQTFFTAFCAICYAVKDRAAFYASPCLRRRSLKSLIKI
jgi:hypothetical protein